MKHSKIFGLALLLGLAFAFPVAAQTVSGSNLLKLSSGTNVVPVVSSWTLGNPSTNGSFHNLVISGSCTGCSGGGLSAQTATTSYDYIVTTSNGVVSAYKTSTGQTVYSNPSTDVVLNDITTAASATGAAIYFGPGTFYLNATSTFGTSSILPGWVLNGSGINVTNFVVSNNADGFFFNGSSKPNFQNFTVYLAGGANGFTASSTNGFAAIQNGNFSNIGITGTTSNSTGWGFNVPDDYVNTFTNIKMQNIGNCLRQANDSEGKFIPGNDIISLLSCSMNNAPSGGSENLYSGGIGFDVDGSASASTKVNDDTFIDDGTTDAGNISNFPFEMNNAQNIQGIDDAFERPTTGLTATNGSQYLNFTWEFVDGSPEGNTTYFSFDSTSNNNTMQCTDVESQDATTSNILLSDGNTSSGKPNVLEGVNGGNCNIEGQNNFTYATTSASLVRDLHNAISGNNSLNNVKITGNAVDLSFGDNPGANFITEVGNVLKFFAGGANQLSISSTAITVLGDLFTTSIQSPSLLTVNATNGNSVVFSSIGVEEFRISGSNKFVSVSSSTPGSLFSIGGVANFTTATSTIYSSGGINLEAGCYAINGTCLGQTVVNTSASSTLLTDNNTFAGNNVFSASTTFPKLINVSNASTSVETIGGTFFTPNVESPGTLTINTTAGNSIIFEDLGVEKMRINGSNGFVAIATSTPTGQLSVGGPSFGTTNGVCYQVKATGSASSYVYYYFTAAAAQVISATTCSGIGTTTITTD